MRLNFSLSIWQFIAYATGFCLSLPLFFLIFESFQPDTDVFEHLKNTVLWDYTYNTVVLIFGVCLLSCIIALPLAWLCAYCEFPGKKHFEWALMLPLAMPTYIIAYVYTDLFDYAGPIQSWLRRVFSWYSPEDYWFFDIRTLGGAMVMIALVLYPYLYLIFKTALKEQSYKLVQASQVMGYSPTKSFFKVSIPLGRGAIAAALALISMETMADFATVHYFAVSTLTTAVYDTWLGYYSLTAAAKISGIMLLFLFVVIGIEKFSRRNMTVVDRSMSENAGVLYILKGRSAWLATLYCALILFAGFLLPVLILAKYAFHYFSESWNSQAFLYAWQSLKIAVLVSVICVVRSVVINFYQRISTSSWAMLPGKIASTGYALPGTVLAVAVLLPLTLFDNVLNQYAQSVTWLDEPGLLFSGTLFALTFAYVVRFYAISQGAIESSYSRISPSLDMASHSMGVSESRTLSKVH